MDDHYTSLDHPDIMEMVQADLQTVPPSPSMEPIIEEYLMLESETVSVRMVESNILDSVHLIPLEKVQPRTQSRPTMIHPVGFERTGRKTKISRREAEGIELEEIVEPSFNVSQNTSAGSKRQRQRRRKTDEEKQKRKETKIRNPNGDYHFRRREGINRKAKFFNRSSGDVMKLVVDIRSKTSVNLKDLQRWKELADTIRVNLEETNVELKSLEDPNHC